MNTGERGLNVAALVVLVPFGSMAGSPRAPFCVSLLPVKRARNELASCEVTL